MVATGPRPRPSRRVRQTHGGSASCYTHTAMALRLALRNGVGGVRTVRWASGARPAGGSCAGPRAPPPCPACAPAPAPTCRAPPPAGPRALRVVCCPPPAGARPPCAPFAPACPLTCDHAAASPTSATCATCATCTTCTTCASPRSEAQSPTRGDCCVEQDFVARRLTLAKRARRADYEQEVADRAHACTRRASPPPAPYRLGDERECAPATDGRQYAVPRGEPECGRCGPGRTPPAPRCVRLAPDDHCRIRTEPSLDPCAHRPRVMIEIDRTAPRSEPEPRPASPPLSAKGIASRLISGLMPSRGPRKEPKVEKKLPAGGGSRCAGDTGWCASPPRPASAPARCRPPTAAERLRGRNPKPGCGERCLHTSAAIRTVASDPVPRSKPADGLAEVVRERSQFGEAGRGRVASDPSCAGGAGPTSAAGGGLELRVPAGVSRVRVRVSLEGAASSPCAPARSPAACRPKGAADVSQVDRNRCLDSAARHGSDSWLSIKNIQKKFAGCRKTQEFPSSKEAGKSAAAPRPCPLPSSPCSPSPAVSPRPSCPPRETITSRCPSSKPQTELSSPGPHKKPDGRCQSKVPSTPAPPRPPAPVCPSRCGQGEVPKAPHGPVRFSPTLGLILNTIADI